MDSRPAEPPSSPLCWLGCASQFSVRPSVISTSHLPELLGECLIMPIWPSVANDVHNLCSPHDSEKMFEIEISVNLGLLETPRSL